ncbi:hypothetical protein BDV25DRAFT_154188 [Aspergillus avenaceus]|uniref:RING-CH-type domain-containing protein n=1 Tax=Aspergillus avenaceus TaxID=36643 RepID=A0A5N6TWA4_ASPAV|nr:hypothetical protein BDV25DRAFT_154188 [Aspergillus avenaceus]
MASVPGYSAPTGQTRLTDPTATTHEEGTSTSESSTSPTTESMEDSETVVLNKHSSSGGNVSDTAVVQSATPPDPNNEPRKCWICYTDETEDSPLNSEWRSPCPCALTAHEECLLDWLADMENPRSRRRHGYDAKMTCPQCKSEIVVSRPRSYIVDVVRFMEKMAGRLVLPGIGFTLAGFVWAGCCAHGVYSMYFVFGPEDARRILDESSDGAWNPGLNLGLPLIPLVLIFSRTRYADGLLPAIPVYYFATHSPGPEVDMHIWPPSAAMTFAALPYIKSFYSSIYDRLFGKLEQKWIAEVQPRQSDINAFDDNAPPEHPEPDPVPDGADGAILELNLGFGVHGVEAADPPPNAQGRRDGLVNETVNLGDVLLGALAFPAISASMGGLLKLVLPKSWTAAQSTLERSRPGLLQTRWGRTVIGGCAFVLLKDVLVLYCRWKLAQTHRRRKVLNYDRSKKVTAKS